MNFIGSARKWRPQRFEDLVGQDVIVYGKIIVNKMNIFIMGRIS